MPNTPIGTRICPTRMPLGCCFMPMISPITSAMAASCSQPWAQVSSTLGLSFKRSTIGSAKPAARARSRSRALSTCNASVCSRSRRARASNALFLIAAGAFAISAEAVFAWRPRECVYSATLRAFIRRFCRSWLYPCALPRCTPPHHHDRHRIRPAHHPGPGSASL